MRKWTLEALHEEALKYKTKVEFLRGSSKAFHSAYYNKVLDDICSHMTPVRKSWSVESVRQEASKYTTRLSFEKGSPSAYGAARRLKILDDVCSHMTILQTKWTLEMLIEAAKPYVTRGGFNKKNPNAYHTAKDWKVLHIVCAHMPEAFVWSIEGLFAEAKKYTKRSDFFKYSKGAYCAAYDRGVLDEICGHMQKVKTGYNKKKTGYLYVLKLSSDNKEYVGFGVTNSIDDRIKQHDLSAAKTGFVVQVIKVFSGDGERILCTERDIKRKFRMIDSGIKGFRRECSSLDNLQAILDFAYEALENAQSYQEAVMDLYKAEMQSK